MYALMSQTDLAIDVYNSSGWWWDDCWCEVEFAGQESKISRYLLFRRTVL